MASYSLRFWLIKHFTAIAPTAKTMLAANHVISLFPCHHFVSLQLLSLYLPTHARNIHPILQETLGDYDNLMDSNIFTDSGNS
jgi:hypothetical protein